MPTGDFNPNCGDILGKRVCNNPNCAIHGGMRLLSGFTAELSPSETDELATLRAENAVLVDEVRRSRSIIAIWVEWKRDYKELVTQRYSEIKYVTSVAATNAIPSLAAKLKENH